jgi:hypothetical protein
VGSFLENYSSPPLRAAKTHEANLRCATHLKAAFSGKKLVDVTASAGGVADEWVTQMLRQGDAQVFKKYSQMKLQMKREALEKLNRRANEMPAEKAGAQSDTVTVQ